MIFIKRVDNRKGKERNDAQLKNARNTFRAIVLQQELLQATYSIGVPMESFAATCCMQDTCVKRRNRLEKSETRLKMSNFARKWPKATIFCRIIRLFP